MNVDERDVVSSVGSAVVASVAMAIFCASAGLPPEITVKGALLLGASVSAAHLVRHGFLLAIAHKFGPIVDPMLSFYKENYFIQMNEAQYWMVVARNEMLGKRDLNPCEPVVLRKISDDEVK